MAQPSANADGVMLFACTKCNSRHPFEDLSQGHQLCKECKSSIQIVKCNYCRSEYQQDITGKSSSICKKCEQLQEQHGKPGPCVYCNIIAAFIGTKCHRCNNSEKKYGPPLACEHCKQKCAFDRTDPESKKKVEGKLLCWLCTMAFKRTLAKARHKESNTKSSLSNSHHRLTSGGDPKGVPSTGRHHGSSSSGHRHHSGTSATTNGGSSSTFQRPSHRHGHHSTSNQSSSHRDPLSTSGSKKQRIDLSSSSNGNLTSSLSSFSDAGRFVDSNNTEMATVVTQLKDQVAALNRRIQQKDKELLSKDQQIADLKSTSAREQRDFRERMSIIQKQHSERLSEMQAKLVSMQKQIASQTKASRAPTNTTSEYPTPPMVI